MRERTIRRRRPRPGKADGQSRKPAQATITELYLELIPPQLFDDIRPLLCARSLRRIVAIGCLREKDNDGLPQRKQAVDELKKKIGVVIDKHLAPEFSHKRGRPRTNTERDARILQLRSEHRNYQQISELLKGKGWPDVTPDAVKQVLWRAKHPQYIRPRPNSKFVPVEHALRISK